MPKSNNPTPHPKKLLLGAGNLLLLKDFHIHTQILEKKGLPTANLMLNTIFCFQIYHILAKIRNLEYQNDYLK